MFYKILFGASIVAALIIIIENLAVGSTGGYLLIAQVDTGSLSLFSTLIGMGAGFGLAGMMIGKKDEDDNYDY